MTCQKLSTQLTQGNPLTLCMYLTVQLYVLQQTEQP